MEDDLAPSKTEGFKVGEKKTIDEYKNLGTLSSTCCFLLLGARNEDKTFKGVRVRVPEHMSIGLISNLHCVHSTSAFYVILQ